MPVITKHYDLDTDGTLSNNSDIIIPSQKAVKTYADTKQSAINDLSYIRTQVSKIDDKIASQDITDSGSALPATTAYSVGDTFLNTNDKKLYTTLAPAWQLNTNTTVPSSISIDLNTGIASGFFCQSSPEGTSVNDIHRSYTPLLTATNPIKVHFKISPTARNAGTNIFTVTHGSPLTYYHSLKVVSNKLHLMYQYYYQGLQTTYDYQLLDTDIELDTEYYLYISLENDEWIITLSNTGYNVNIIETGQVTNVSGISGGTFYYGGVSNYYAYTRDGLIVYLLDSIGEFLIPDGALTWDSGVTLEDNTQYNDTTNEKTYYYNNNILYKLAEVAKTGSYNDLTDKPTIPTVNDATLTIQQNGTTLTTFSANASSNVTMNLITSLVKFRDWSDE